MTGQLCRACGGFLYATTEDDVYECANCGLKRDYSDPDDLEVNK